MKTIASYRKEIDQLHEELRALLFRRRDLTVEIWKLKQAHGDAFYNPEREAQIIHEFITQGTSKEADPQMDVLLKAVMQTLLREYRTYLHSKFTTES